MCGGVWGVNVQVFRHRLGVLPAMLCYAEK